jgi:hypothetical protein
MSETTERKFIRIHEDGSSELVRELSSQREIPEAIIRRFGAEVVRYMHRVFPMAGGEAHMIMTDKERYAVRRLESLTLLCHYELEADSLLHPVFLKATQPAAAGKILMAPVWKAPDTMRLFFAARIYNWTESPEPVKTWHDHGCYLIAYDGNKRAYRLPLSNLYDDFAVCMGVFDGRGDTAQSAFGAACKQFDASDWNSDLSGGREAQARKLFKFDPANNNAQVDHSGRWTDYCDKNSTPISMLIGGLLP